MSAWRDVSLRLAGLPVLVFVTLTQSGLLGGISTHDLTLAIPYLVSRGMRLYVDVFSFHPPLLTWLLAAVYRFADPLTSLRILNVLFVVGTGAAVLWVARRCWGPLHGASGLLFYVVWATAYNNMFFYVDGLVGTMSALVLLMGTASLSPVALVLMGLAAGVGAALKPNALLLLFAAPLWLLCGARAGRRRALGHSMLVLASSLLVYVTPLAALALTGSWPMAKRALFNPGNASWLAGAANLLNGNAWRALALTVAWLPAFGLCRLPTRGSGGFPFLLWLVFGATVVLNVPAPGYYHAMAFLPAVSVMSGAIIGWALESGVRAVRREGWRAAVARATFADRAFAGLVTGLLLATLVTALTPLSVLLHGGPFGITGWDELRPVSEWVTANTRPEDRVLVLPAKDTNGNIYPQSGRLPPFYMKTWLEHASVPDNARLLYRRVEETPPAVVVLFPDLYRDVGEYFPELNAFVARTYHEVGRIDGLPLQGHVVFLRDD
jgi:hypothetical protein